MPAENKKNAPLAGEEIIDKKTAKIISEVIEEVPEKEIVWNPVSLVGKKVKSGEIGDIDELFNQGYKIMEAEIADKLVPGLEEELLMTGQAKGKFGGGQRRVFKQTQKKTAEGNKIHFLTCAAVGNRNGYLGIGLGKSRETVPSREKARREAKLNLIRIRRGCGSWECSCRQPHSIPFAVEGRCGSSRITLIPAPRGKGLCIEKECATILTLAGIKDIWSKTTGQTSTKINLIQALVKALKKLSEMKIRPEDIRQLGIVEGRIKEAELPPVSEPGPEPESGSGPAAGPNPDEIRREEARK